MGFFGTLLIVISVITAFMAIIGFLTDALPRGVDFEDIGMLIILAWISFTCYKWGNSFRKKAQEKAMKEEEEELLQKYFYLIIHQRILSIPLIATFMQTNQNEAHKKIQKLIDLRMLPDARIDIEDMVVVVPGLNKQIEIEGTHHHDVPANNGFSPLHNSFEEISSKEAYGQEKSKQATIPWSGGTYEGYLVSNLPQGKGRLVLPDNTIYCGDWVQGKPSGYGEINFSNGAFYQGEFYDGEMHGKGSYTYQDGRKLTGKWDYGRFIEHSY